MKKVTKATLKALARKGKLFSQIKSSFDGMVDGFSDHQKENKFTPITVEEIDRIWCSYNWIDVDENNNPCLLTNCCYRMSLKVI